MKKKTNKSSKPLDLGANLENLPKLRTTVETMQTPAFIEAVKTADVILTFPTSAEGNPQIAYGTQALQSIASGGSAVVKHILSIAIDWTTTEPDYLAALIHQLKGKCDFD